MLQFNDKEVLSLHENEFLCSLWQHKETFMFFYGAL